MTELELFASKLRGRIAEKNISRSELARMSGVSADAIGKYCQAYCQPTMSKILALARSLDTTPNALLGWDSKDGR